MDENELCKVGDFGLLRETGRRTDDDEEKHYVMQVRPHYTHLYIYFTIIEIHVMYLH